MGGGGSVPLTQTIKHRDEHGKLLSVEIRAVLGEIVSEPGTVHIERVNGTLHDRLNALIRHPACLCETRCHVGCARRLPPAHPPAAVFLRERLHVIQWLGMSMLLAGGTDACGEDMLHPTNWNKPTRFYVSSREKKRWHPPFLEHKELLP